MTSAAGKIAVHVEITICANCPRKAKDVSELVRSWLQLKCPIFKNGQLALDAEVSSLTSSIAVVDLPPGKCVSFWQADLCLHAFRLSDQGPENECLEGEEQLPAAEQWELPNAQLSNLWSSIIISNTIKSRLLSYCSSFIRFSEARVDTDIIAWNRMILLHGPPGTGKTTICKGLAQKTFIRNADRFSDGMLLEINSHSLFSKWFSESGKLVMKLFAHIAEIAEDEERMVVVLIDEVESITASRGSAARSNEPGDAVRVVNAVLTSLDALKRRPNVLVLCTSNLIASVDPAFLDRVDMKVHLGPPPVQARYDILHSCVAELMHRGIVSPAQDLCGSCSSVEEQLLQRYVAAATRTVKGTVAAGTGVGAGVGAGVGLVGQRKREETLAAIVRSVATPVLDDGGIFGAEEVEGQSPVSATAARSEGQKLQAGGTPGIAEESEELYWPETQQSETPQSAAVDSQQTVTNSSLLSGDDVSMGGDSPPLLPATTAGAKAGTFSAQQLRLSAEQYLYIVAALCEGMSGRALRKLPLKAHSYYVQHPTVTLLDFVAAMHATIEAEKVMGTGVDLS